jgi:hypothetical protein
MFEKKTRRKLITSLTVGGGIVYQLPKMWIKPEVVSVILPAHAQTTEEEDEVQEIENITGPFTGTSSDSSTAFLDFRPQKTDSLFDKIAQPAYAQSECEITITGTVCLEVISSTSNSAVVNVEAAAVIEGLGCLESSYDDPVVEVFSVIENVTIPTSETLQLTATDGSCGYFTSLDLDIFLEEESIPSVDFNLVNSIPAGYTGDDFVPPTLSFSLLSGDCSLPAELELCEIIDIDDASPTQGPG